MDRVFLDANVLFSAAYRPGGGLRCLWELDDALLISSGYAVQEARHNLGTASQQQDLKYLLKGIEVIEHQLTNTSSITEEVDLPDKDVPILLAAISARCTHLLTGDVRHFGKYLGKSVQGVLLLRPAVYMQRRQAR